MKTAVICIIKEGGKVLFVKRAMDKKRFPGMWSLPAGGMEGDETPFETASREMREELGIRIKVLKILECHYEDSLDVMQIFLLCSTGDKPKIIDRENTEFKWEPLTGFLESHKDEDVPYGLRYIRKRMKIWEGL